MKILVLGLGNDLLADDGVGVLAARALQERLSGKADAHECPLAGVALLEEFLGYDRAIIIDAIQSGSHPAGTIREIDPDHLSNLIAPSPHYTGLPELFRIAKELSLDFPAQVAIFAMEVADPRTIGGEMSPQVRAALPVLLDQVEARVNSWLHEA